MRHLAFASAVGIKTLIVVVMKSVGHYHAARFRALSVFFPVTIISASGESSFPEFAASRGDISFHVEAAYPSDREYGLAVQRRLLEKDLCRRLDRLQPEAVAISGWVEPESIAALSWAKRNRIPTVLFSDSQEHDAERSWMREAIKKVVIREFDSALVSGRSAALYLRKLGMSREMIFEGYDVIDNDYFARRTERLRSGSQSAGAEGLPPRFILASCRFIPKKNLCSLVLAYDKYRKQNNSPFPLVLLGQGPEGPKLDALISELGIGSLVTLPGFVDYQRLPEFYANAICFVHFSLVEQWGLVINEAMASGLPVIASNTCGAAIELLRDRVNGFTVDPHNVASLSSALQRVHNMSDQERMAMGLRAKTTVALFSPERFAFGVVEALLAAKARKRFRPLDALWFLIRPAVFGRLIRSRVEMVS